MAKLEADLLSRLHRRNPAALRAVVLDNTRPLYRAARALGFSQPEAEDLAQSVLATFIETIDRFEGRSLVRTWLFGILHRKIFGQRREKLKETRNDPIDEVFESRFDSRGGWMRPPADLHRLLQSKEIGAAIKSCLQTLPARQRTTFVLREMEQLETAQICKILDVTDTYLGVLLYRARHRLRECLESRGWGKKT